MSEDDAKIREIVSAELAQLDVADDVALAAGPEGVRDLKNIFCNHWPNAKDVLEFLKPYLPTLVRLPLTVLIRIGDRVHATICPG